MDYWTCIYVKLCLFPCLCNVIDHVQKKWTCGHADHTNLHIDILVPITTSHPLPSNVGIKPIWFWVLTELALDWSHQIYNCPSLTVQFVIWLTMVSLWFTPQAEPTDRRPRQSDRVRSRPPLPTRQYRPLDVYDRRSADTNDRFLVVKARAPPRKLPRAQINYQQYDDALLWWTPIDYRIYYNRLMQQSPECMSIPGQGVKRHCSK